MLSWITSLNFGEVPVKGEKILALALVWVMSVLTPIFSANFLALGIAPNTPIDPVIVLGEATIVSAAPAI